MQSRDRPLIGIDQLAEGLRLTATRKEGLVAPAVAARTPRNGAQALGLRLTPQHHRMDAFLPHFLPKISASTFRTLVLTSSPPRSNPLIGQAMLPADDGSPKAFAQ